MLVQVHAHEKPAFRRRTIAASIGLLAISTGLASSLSRGGRGTQPESVIGPRGWSVSFRAPAGARAMALRPGLLDRFLLRVPTPSGTVAQLGALRIGKLAETDLQATAEGVLFRFGSPSPHAVGNLSVVWRDKKLGIHDALELWDPGVGWVVRVGRVRSGEVYAVAFNILRSRIDPDSYDIFERFCRSVEDRSN